MAAQSELKAKSWLEELYDLESLTAPKILAILLGFNTLRIITAVAHWKKERILSTISWPPSQKTGWALKVDLKRAANKPGELIILPIIWEKDGPPEVIDAIAFLKDVVK